MNELTILETSKFTKWVKRNKLRSAVNALQAELRADRTVGDVIPGASGLRKVRMAGLGRGKSGGFRVVYVLILDQSTAVLMTGYSKSEQEDLTPDELKQLTKAVETLTQGE